MLAAANGQMYSYKVEIDSVAGLIHVYRGGVLQVQWTDSTPLSSGDSIALTTESSAVTFDDVTVTQLPKTLLYIHTNHLGSVTVLTYGNDYMTALHGKPVPTTGALYLPFGAYRLDPNAKVTNYGFTGHVENRSVGLTYMNARYYLSDLGRFASADTIVPDPGNPQAFNRYSYVGNNPVNLRDPDGRCPTNDTACWALADELYEQFGWQLAGLNSNGRWTLEELQVLWDAALKLEAWFSQFGSDARGLLRGTFGGTEFVKAGVVGIGILGGRHHARGSQVHFLPGFKVRNVVHELAHVLDNSLSFGNDPLAALFGGGESDDFARALGFNPTQCFSRSECTRIPFFGTYNIYENAKLKESHPTPYSKSGPSEDFAETFRLSVLEPTRLTNFPLRQGYMLQLGGSLTTNVGEFQGTPYSRADRFGVGGLGGAGEIPLID